MLFVTGTARERPGTIPAGADGTRRQPIRFSLLERAMASVRGDSIRWCASGLLTDFEATTRQEPNLRNLFAKDRSRSQECRRDALGPRRHRRDRQLIARAG